MAKIKEQASENALRIKPEVYTDKGYSMIRQSADTNILTKMLPNSLNELNNVVKNPVTGSYEITRDGLTWTLPSFLIEPKNGIKTATHKVFDFVRIQFTNNGNEKRIVFAIEDYMAWRNIKDRTQAAKEIDDAAKAFMRAEISYESTKPARDYTGLHVVQDADTKKKQYIEITLGDKFAELLKSYPQMWYCNAAGATNDKRNKHSYYFLTRIQEHYRMNEKHPNANIISVKTLLKSAPEAPSYRVIAEKRDGALGRKLIDPFEKDMNALEEAGAIKWEYCMSGGAPLATGKEHLAYKTWINLFIKFELINYPRTEELRKPTKQKRLEAKNES